MAYLAVPTLLLHTTEELLKPPVLGHPLIFGLLLIPLVLVWVRRHVVGKLLFRRGRLPLPPGPPKLPLIGNLHQIGLQPHRSLRQLARKYGPLMSLQLGQVPTLVVSSPAVAAEVLKYQDDVFGTRPPLSSVRSIFYGGMDVAFTPYNPYWRQMRRICAQELFTRRRVHLFRLLREEEIWSLVRAIRRASPAPVNMSDLLLRLLNSITCREVFGKRLEEEEEEEDRGRSSFHDLITEWTHLMGHFNVGEYFPSLEWLNVFSGLRRRFQKNFDAMDAFLDEVIDTHCSYHPERDDELHNEYLISVLLRFLEDSSLPLPISRTQVKAVLMDVFIAGTDTGALTLEWGMAELVKNPRVMKKAQEEVRRVVGEAEVVEEHHVQNLPYLKLLVREILRMHPPGPFLLPRMSRRDCEVLGYHVPADVKVTINVWAIGRDPSAWEEPDTFRPERFEGSDVDFRGQHFQLLPFGSGRRGCPGVHLGSTIVELALANLLHCFDWETADGGRGEDLDMEEYFGIVLRRKTDLLLRATPWKGTEVVR